MEVSVPNTLERKGEAGQSPPQRFRHAGIVSAALGWAGSRYNIPRRIVVDFRVRVRGGAALFACAYGFAGKTAIRSPRNAPIQISPSTGTAMVAWPKVSSSSRSSSEVTTSVCGLMRTAWLECSSWPAP